MSANELNTQWTRLHQSYTTNASLVNHAYTALVAAYQANGRQPDNEEQSAETAVKHLHEIGYPADKTAMVKDFIIATKTHINTHHDPDLDYFLDFDLCILGASPEAYREYAQQIRNEYSIYPDEVYQPGRKKVLQHFLDMPAIFRTTVFRELYETTARENILAEIELYN